MIDDQEIKAMGTIVEALDGLDDEAITRVLRWTRDRFGIEVAELERRTGDETPEEREDDNPNSNTFESFADLYDAADPETDPERALVGGYWFQVIEGKSDFRSRAVNDALKNLGHGVNEISKAFGWLIDQHPRLVMQLEKKGSTRQARKRYKLTRAGITRVKEMTQADESEA